MSIATPRPEHSGRDPLNDLPGSQEQLGNLGRTKLFELIRKGELASVKIGRRRMIPQSAIDAYVARLRAAQAISPVDTEDRP